MFWRLAGVGVLALILSMCTEWVYEREWTEDGIERCMDTIRNAIGVKPLSVSGSMSGNGNAEPINDQPISFGVQSDGPALDTTAVILNWSRLENVVLIVSAFCLHWPLSVLVWNNNPNLSLSIHHFHQSNCSPGKLSIYNSPRNIYFQARFLACQSSNTTYCFIQDDDFLIHPTIIRNIHDFVVLDNFTHPVHLLPPNEHLSSRMTTSVAKDCTVATSFAWLGYGTFLRRDTVVSFLTHLARLNLSEEETRMADNYFSILYNRIAEIWFDHNIPLGGGTPFTVGSEGEARNNKHMMNALHYLRHNKQLSPAPDPTQSQLIPIINRAPCRLAVCILHTNISLLPTDLFQPIDSELAMLDVARERMNTLGQERVQRYIQHPLSFAVDNRPETAFRSEKAVQYGDWLTLDVLTTNYNASACFQLLVSEEMIDVIRECSLSVSHDGMTWRKLEESLVCAGGSEISARTGDIVNCSARLQVLDWHSRFIRIMYEGDLSNVGWTVHEVLVRKNDLQCIRKK